jgi:hypothetical protein
MPKLGLVSEERMASLQLEIRTHKLCRDILRSTESVHVRSLADAVNSWFTHAQEH